MNMKEIRSSSNVEVKYLKKVRRGGEPFFLVEGEKLITIALDEGFYLESTWLIVGQTRPSWCQETSVRMVPSSLYGAISPTKKASGPMALFRKPERALDIFSELRGRYLLLDGVQDPGNAGALIRAAAGFNLDGVLWHGIRPGLFHHSTIRSSAGTVFQVKHFEFEEAGESPLRTEGDTPVFIGTSAKQGEVIPAYIWPDSFVLCLGNEGHGLSTLMQKRCQQLVSIPINPKVESLNVAGAAHVLLYQSNQKRI